MLISILSIAVSSNVNAQHNAVLKAAVVPSLWGVYQMSFEQAVGRSFSGEIGLQGGRYLFSAPVRDERYEVCGAGVIGEVRYYPVSKKRTAPAGLVIGSILRYVDFREKYCLNSSRYDVGGKAYSIAFVGGYKFTYRRLGLEVLLGRGSGKVESDDRAYRSAIIPAFHRKSFDDQQMRFNFLEITVGYMISPFVKRTG